MRELLDAFPRHPYTHGTGHLLLDTCFVIDQAARGQLARLDRPVALTSFNAEELLHVEHRLDDHVKKALRRWLKEVPRLTLVDVPVHPGERERERDFVKSIDPHLLSRIGDASDAVLLAVALHTRSDVFTKDKHHLFTAALENYLHDYGVRVWKEWKDAEN